MKIKGKTHKFGNDINTDEIIPARYLNTCDAKELAQHCMEDADPDFVTKMHTGDIIVAGKNFGCGSSREHAPLSIKAAGVSCVIAKSFARIFFRNAINIGLPIFEIDQADTINSGDELEVDADAGIIKNCTQNKKYTTSSLPQFMQELINSGGLVPWTKNILSS